MFASSDMDVYKLIGDVLNSESSSFPDLLATANLDPRSDLKYANLSGISFDDLDLSGYDFTGCNLKGCSFKRTKIVGANFSHALYHLAALQEAADWQQFNKNKNTSADISSKIEPIRIANSLLNFNLDLRILKFTDIDSGMDRIGSEPVLFDQTVRRVSLASGEFNAARSCVDTVESQKRFERAATMLSSALLAVAPLERDISVNGDHFYSRLQLAHADALSFATPMSARNGHAEKIFKNRSFSSTPQHAAFACGLARTATNYDNLSYAIAKLRQFDSQANKFRGEQIVIKAEVTSHISYGFMRLAEMSRSRAKLLKNTTSAIFYADKLFNVIDKNEEILLRQNGDYLHNRLKAYTIRLFVLMRALSLLKTHEAIRDQLLGALAAEERRPSIKIPSESAVLDYIATAFLVLGDWTSADDIAKQILTIGASERTGPYYRAQEIRRAKAVMSGVTSEPSGIPPK